MTNEKEKTTRTVIEDLFQIEQDFEIQIRKFSDIICASLEDNQRKHLAQCIKRTIGTYEDEDYIIRLKPLRGKYGAHTQLPTHK